MINLSHYNITDDIIGIKHERSMSIVDVINYLNKSSELVTNINLSDNKISIDGAIQIIDYTINYLPGVSCIDLSHNNLNYNQIDSKKFIKFNKLLSILLQRSNISIIIDKCSCLSPCNFQIYNKLNPI